MKDISLQKNPLFREAVIAVSSGPPDRKTLANQTQRFGFRTAVKEKTKISKDSFICSSACAYIFWTFNKLAFIAQESVESVLDCPQGYNLSHRQNKPPVCLSLQVVEFQILLTRKLWTRASLWNFSWTDYDCLYGFEGTNLNRATT